MPYKEKDLTADFSKYLRTNPDATKIKFTFGVEFKCKHGKEKLHLIRDFQSQQLPALLQTAHSCVYVKQSDMSLGLKCYDAMQICYSPAFVGVMWYKPRQPKLLYLIDIRDIDHIMQNKCVTLTEEEASKLAVFTIKL